MVIHTLPVRYIKRQFFLFLVTRKFRLFVARVIKPDRSLVSHTLRYEQYQGTTVNRTVLPPVCPVAVLDSLTLHTATLTAFVGVSVGVRHPAAIFILKMATATYGEEVKAGSVDGAGVVDRVTQRESSGPLLQ